jgi:thiamine-phosphate pyrophosphorylase
LEQAAARLPWVTDLDNLRARLDRARLYLICDAGPDGRTLEAALAPALAGGVDIFQLRDKLASEDELRRAAERARALTEATGALFIVNDRPDLAVAVGADGVHIGQHDGSPARARAAIGPDRLLGISTHSPDQVTAAAGQGADYIGVGPVHATPTKPGRPAVGLALVSYAAAHAGLPFFAIGGLDAGNAGEAIRAGARRLAVVRAIAEAADPREAARALRAALDATGDAGTEHEAVSVGTT